MSIKDIWKKLTSRAKENVEKENMIITSSKMLSEVQLFDDVTLKFEDEARPYAGWISEKTICSLSIVYTDKNKKIQEITVHYSRPYNVNSITDKNVTIFF